MHSVGPKMRIMCSEQFAHCTVDDIGNDTRMMNWNKFFIGTTHHHGDQGDKTDTESDDEEITDSNATVSTDKKPCFVGIEFDKFPCSYLSQRCTKFMFIMLNSALFLAGIVGSVIAIWTLTDSVIMSRFIRPRFFTMTLLIISLIVSIVSLIGLLGLLQRRKKFLKIYILCYVLFLCTILVCGLFSYWIFEEIVRAIHKDMRSSIQHYETSPSSKESWDNTQRYLQCCGIHSVLDWVTNYEEIPKSCCARPIEECLRMTEAVVYDLGCLRSVMHLLASYIRAMSIAAVLIFLVLLLNFLLALCILLRMVIDCPCPE